MSKIDPHLIRYLSERLESFDRTAYSLPGIMDAESKECFIAQIVDSLRRVKYVTIIRDKHLTGQCANASLSTFNPIWAASWHLRSGNLDEAMWLTFLSTYFGKSSSGWALIRGFYSALGTSPAYWTWERVYHNFEDLANWLMVNAENVKQLGVFSNHRRYTSFRADSDRGPIRVFSTYRDWVGNNGSHYEKILRSINQATKTGQPTFRVFYNSIPSGMSLKRLGKFDYLTMVSKLGIVNMAADSTYMSGATGPKSGAKLLFWGDRNISIANKEIEARMDNLANYLNIDHAMQVVEDSVCNWQKSPRTYVKFAG